jgi:hypothetical protein
MKNRFFQPIVCAGLLATASLPCQLGAQDQPPPGDLGALFTAIKAQESNFPLPNASETILVGTVDLSVLQHAFQGGSPLNTCLNNNYDANNVFTYAVPTYTNGTSAPIGCGHLPHGWQWPTVQSVGAQVTVANVRHLNLQFSVTGTAPSWATNGGQVVFQLGNAPQQIVPATGGQSVTFNDVAATSLPLTITIHWIDPRLSPPQVGGVSTDGVGVGGLLPVQVSWSTIGAGAVTIPALPVAIVYAPPVDAQKKNQATSTTSRTLGNTTTVSFTSSSSTTHPVPSQFQTTTDISKGMSALGQVLSKIHDPDHIAEGVGGGLTVLSSLLGSSSASQTASQAATSQHSLAVSNTSAVSLVTSANDGGPGVGDIIAYFYKARVLWYSVNGAMTLALLGSDGFASPSAQRLQNALSALNSQPPGTVDPDWHIDAVTIAQLLKLDPFVAGGPGVQLPSPRFAESQNGVVDPGAGEMTYVAQTTVTATELTSTTTSTLNVENDSEGLFSSFLNIPIGVTTSQTLQSEVSQSSLNQVASGQSVTQSYNFYNNGSEHYECEVYFDAIFGTFAFRDVTTNAQPALSGKLVDRQGHAIANSTIALNVGKRTFVTNTDSTGSFALHLSGITSGSITVNTTKGETDLKYRGTPIKNVILRAQ